MSEIKEQTVPQRLRDLILHLDRDVNRYIIITVQLHSFFEFLCTVGFA